MTLRIDLRAIIDDLYTLGRSAPLRAAYEASKRSGFHAVLFGGGTPRHHQVSLVRLTGTVPVNDVVARRCLDDAQAVLREGVRVFGHRVTTGVKAPWSTDPLTGRQWPAEPWWRIDIRSPARLSDVKHTWEAARHRDLVVLARAASLEPSGPWLDQLVEMLQSWCIQSCLERGVNWYSSLELALRTIGWDQILVLVGDRLPQELVITMERHLLASARHLMVELPYTMSSMRNNHMLGDALGLIMLARIFPTAPQARWWAAVGERMFTAQQRRHVDRDGRMIEDSLSYHRFVLEMLAVRMLLGDAPSSVRRDLHAASLHLARLGVLDGDVPQYGDWDEGRVLASSGDPLDVAGSTALGLALCGERLPSRWYAEFDELAWYAPASARFDARTRGEGWRSREAPLVSGGIARAERGPWQVWFKVDSGPSHGHADLTSVYVKHEGRWLIADPGTGTYNGALDIRNGLRASSAHPVRRLDGQDQLVPYRTFRWRHTARGRLAAPLDLPGRTVLFGWHDAYVRGEQSVRVGRAVVLADQYVAVVEFADPPARNRSWSMTVPLHPDVTVCGDSLVVGGSLIKLFGLAERSMVRGQSAPFAGWHSRTYGSWEPATWISADSRSDTDVWGLGDLPESHAPGTVDGLRFEATWKPAGCSLAITDLSADEVHHLGATG